jgi:hypothetical protein
MPLASDSPERLQVLLTKVGYTLDYVVETAPDSSAV